MESNTATRALDALSHPERLAVFRLLVRRGAGGMRPSEIAEVRGLKPNTLSVYLSALEAAGLVSSERQGRSVFYRPCLSQVGALVDYLIADCCLGRPDLCSSQFSTGLSQARKEPDMADKRFNVLFICTGNSARSIFAEALLNDLGGARFVAHSGGLDPASKLNPYAVEVLERAGHPIDALRSKHISEYQAPDAPQLDFVFTVCDAAANEACAPWSGLPITAHWGQPDPVKVDGTEAEKAFAFAEIYRQTRRRIESFVNLPLQTLDTLSLQHRLDEIGQT